MLQELAPHHTGYIGLKQNLKRYREIASQGGWPTISGSKILKKGARGEHVLRLRQRLTATSDLKEQGKEENSSRFDAALEKAVRRFQKRCGLTVDGIVGRQTLAALNRPVEKRIRQIEFNLERWRWLPRRLDDRYVIVNVAEAMLRACQEDQEVLTTRVIAGHPAQQTRLFNDQIEAVVLNPYWNVPESIALGTILPRARQNPHYLSRKHLEVVMEKDNTIKTMDPSRIQWSRLNAKSFSAVSGQRLIHFDRNQVHGMPSGDLNSSFQTALISMCMTHRTDTSSGKITGRSAAAVSG